MKRWTIFVGTLAVMAAVFAPGCSSSGGTATDYASLIANLEAQGATVVEAGEITQPFFDVTGKSLTVDGETVQVFEYADDAAMAAEADMISEDGGTIGTSIPSWISDPHFYKAGRIIVLYVGTDAGVMDELRQALGAQFAGR
jgi:hypothetical protein